MGSGLSCVFSEGHTGAGVVVAVQAASQFPGGKFTGSEGWTRTGYEKLSILVPLLDL